MTKKLLNICNKTINHFKRLLKDNNSKYISIGVEGGGCNGFRYYIKPTNEEPHKLDEVIIKEGVQINVCGKSLFHLIGTEIKWNDDYMGSGIVFNNPNAQHTCGCGDTFSL